MTPTIVHRYSIPTADALRTLLDIGDCEKVDVFIVGENLVFDVIAPAEGVRSGNDDFPGDLPPKSNENSAVDDDPETVNETAVSADQATPESELKGGPLARRAAMMCQEKGFWTFSETESAEEAADWLREVCGVASRAVLDHDDQAAQKFDRIEGKYRRWLQGYDD